MPTNRISIDIIDVATPCPAEWDKMAGDERVRFCSDCKLNVYQISELTRDEAETLINAHEGRLCVRLFRRHDGTILTRDCPIGLRAVRRQLARALAGIAALIGVLTFGTLHARANSSGVPGSGPLAKLIEWVDGGQQFGGKLQMMQGAMVLQPQHTASPHPPQSNPATPTP